MEKSQDKSTKPQKDWTPEEFQKWSEESMQRDIINHNRCIQEQAKGQSTIPAIELGTNKQIGPAWRELQSLSPHGLDNHPRIVLLRSQISALSVPDDYKSKLLCSIDTYQDQILARPEVPIDGSWDDLEATQQVTLGDMVENWFNRQRENSSVNSPTDRLHVSVDTFGGCSMSKDPEFVNYNVNMEVHHSINEIWNWRNEYGIQLKVFANIDGSGFNYYMCEFQTLEHAQVFIRHFNITGDRRLWAEGKDGNVHYLDISEREG